MDFRATETPELLDVRFLSQLSYFSTRSQKGSRAVASPLLKLDGRRDRPSNATLASPEASRDAARAIAPPNRREKTIVVDRRVLGKSLAIVVDYLPRSNANRPGINIRPQYITIHMTSNPSPGADAIRHAGYLRSSEAQRQPVSWHYTVDDRRCIQHLPITEKAFHAGSNGNNRSIGIEICMHQGINQVLANRRAAALAALLLYDLKLPIARVVPHFFWTGKGCPILLLDSGRPGRTWQEFLQVTNWFYRSIEPRLDRRYLGLVIGGAVGLGVLSLSDRFDV